MDKNLILRYRMDMSKTLILISWIIGSFLTQKTFGQLTTDMNRLNVISALVRYSYFDPLTGEHEHGKGELGRYATNSPVHPVSGQLVHVQDEEGGNNGCSDPVNVPSENWIALIQRGVCKFEDKIINAAVYNNASAVIIYNNIDENELLTMMHSVDHVVSVFIHKKDGDLLSSLVDSGTAVEIDISIGQITMYEIIKSSGFKPSILLIVSMSMVTLLILGLALLLFCAIRKAKRKKKNTHPNIVFTLHKPGQVHESLLSDLHEAGEQSHTQHDNSV